MATELRPYQAHAVHLIRNHARSGGRGIVLQMPTGSGKTACFSNIIRGAFDKGTPCVMVVSGQQLVHQASERFKREDVPHGIYQGARTRDNHHLVQMCSISTLFRRKVAPPARIVVIDECHLSHSDGYKWLLEQYPSAFILGVSATPHHKKGMRHLADKLIMPIRFDELVVGGYLVGGKYFAPYTINVQGIRTKNGEFDASELSDRSIDDEELTASAAKVWDANLRGRMTLAYAVSVAHAEIISERLRQVGARTVVVTGKTPLDERSVAINELERSALDVIVSVGTLTTGIDIPALDAILCCRPTKSYNLWVQILGRGTRPFPGKTHFLVYDLSGNVQRHGRIEDEMEANLDTDVEKQKPDMVFCKKCFAIFNAAPECPECGWVVEEVSGPRGPRSINQSGLTDNSEIGEYVPEPWEWEFPKFVEVARKRGYNKYWVWRQIENGYGPEFELSVKRRLRGVTQWPMITRSH